MRPTFRILELIAPTMSHVPLGGRSPCGPLAAGALSDNSGLFTVLKLWSLRQTRCDSLDHVGPAASLNVVYEAGPSGYVLVRTLRGRNYAYDVIAPYKIARRPGASRPRGKFGNALSRCADANQGVMRSICPSSRWQARSLEGTSAATVDAPSPRACLPRQDGLDSGSRALSGADLVLAPSLHGSYEIDFSRGY